MRPVLALLLAAAAAVPTGPTYIVDALPQRGGAVDGLWRPTPAEARAARVALRRFLQSSEIDRLSAWQQAQARNIGPTVDGYSVQAEGVRAPGSQQFYATSGNGPKQIHLDGFCPGSMKGRERQLQTGSFIVFDGGPCYFQAMYDVAGDRITFFSSNGYA